MDIQQQVLSAITSTGMRPSEIMKATGISRYQVLSALFKLTGKQLIRKERIGVKDVRYSLPEGKSAPAPLPDWLMPKVLTPEQVGNIRTINFMDTAEPPRKVAQPRSLYV